MALSKIVFKPGINRDQTNYASEGGWYSCDKIRFRSGFPEKIGGWLVQTLAPYVGVARAVYPWITASGAELTAVGTNEKIYLVVSSNLIDITPIRYTFTHSTTPSTDNCLWAVSGSTTVTVHLTAHGCVTGDWVTISGATTFAGIPAVDLNKEFKISNVTTNTFDITVATAATSTVNGGGGTAISIAAQINVGNNNVTAGYGWGAGVWGRGSWGSGTTTPVYQKARLVFFQNFNDDLIFNINGSDIYYWAYDPSYTTRAVYMSSLAGASAVPQQVGQILFASTGHLLAMGCTTYDATAPAPDYTGYFDPLMVRWANVDADIGPEPENWKPELTNTAGFFRLQAGSEIVAAINTRQETLIWTNTSLYSMQFLGTEEVFGQQNLSAHVTIMGPNAVAGANNVTYWMGNDKFYSYSGRVDTLPCTLRQYVFQDINRTQAQIVFSGTNAQFNEIIWFYCSENSSQIDRYVVYNYAENIWYYGQLARTAWVDAGNTHYPIGLQDGWVYEHERGNNDGQPYGASPLPLESYIQSADIDIDDGDQFMLIKRIVPDVNFTNSETTNPVTGVSVTPEVTLTVGVRNFPGAVSDTENASNISSARQVVTTATIDQYTNQVFVRARGRQMNFRISSNNLGTQWQLGMPRVDSRPDGRRG